MRPTAAICLLLIALTLLVFAQTIRFDFVNLDDPEYVIDNTHVHAGLTLDALRWAVTTGQESIWHPLTSLSFLLDGQLFGLNPAGYHATNVLLHTVNTLLLFAVLQFMTAARWRSALVAALFALHPLHVEPVAWISQRKDVLSVCFALLTIWAYATYAKQSSARWYLLTLLLLVLGLTAKPMLVTLPFVLLLLDYWPLHRCRPAPRRLSALLIEKTPMLAPAAAVCVITFVKQQASGAMTPPQLISLALRLANAAVAYVRYLGKMFVPTNLSVMYPHPNMSGGTAWTTWQITAAVAVLLLITVAVVVAARRRYALVGWLWFLGTLVPVIGLVQVGRQAMADRYSYLPLIGPFILMVWAVVDLLSRWPRRPALQARFAAAVSVLVLIAFASAAFIQTSHWRNSISLYTHSLHATATSPTLHNNLGLAVQDQGDFNRADQHYRDALEIDGDYFEANGNLGVLLYLTEKPDEALVYLRRAVGIQPTRAGAHFNLAKALHAAGQLDMAIAHFIRATELKPDFAEAHNDLASALLSRGDHEKAFEHASRAEQLKPDLAEAHFNMGTVLLMRDDFEPAAMHLRRALQLKADYAQAHNNLANALAALGQLDEAIHHFREALRIDPDLAAARLGLDRALEFKAATIDD